MHIFLNYAYLSLYPKKKYLTPILLKILFESLGIDLKIFKELAEVFFV